MVAASAAAAVEAVGAGGGKEAKEGALAGEAVEAGETGAQKEDEGEGAGESPRAAGGTARIKNHLGTASTHARLIISSRLAASASPSLGYPIDAAESRVIKEVRRAGCGGCTKQ